MRVNEIFYSLQGEGRYTGTPAVFVRFSGCNLKCDFCDTLHESGTELTESEIVEAVCQHPAAHVVLTGGEPTLQITASLLESLHAADKIIHIETNGTRQLAPGIIDRIDWITVSPKFGIHPEIQRIDELKVVFDMNHTEYIDSLAGITITDIECYYLQPCDRNDAAYNTLNLTTCIDYIKSHPQWKLSLQTHKLLGIR